jgi:ubiquinone/menaquinone biosynthesis C-methylase UbiE
VSSSQSSKPQWGDSYRLIASERWKAKSASMGRHVTQALVDYAQPRPGMNILDLASGTGEPAITLASLVGPEGHATALDISPELLEIADQRARERGLRNFSTRQADAHDLPFPEHSFDLVTSRFGVMFFADIDRALRQAHRVLKPGARACFLVWGPLEQPYFLSTFGVVARLVGGPALSPEGPNPFRFAEPGSLSAVLKKAQFKEVSEETKTVPWTWPGSAEEVWEYARSVSMPFRALLDRVPKEKWAEINREIYESVGRYARGDGIEFGAVVVLASGTKA